MRIKLHACVLNCAYAAAQRFSPSSKARVFKFENEVINICLIKYIITKKDIFLIKV